MKQSPLYLVCILILINGCVNKSINKNDYYFDIVYKSFKDVLAFELEFSISHLIKKGIDVSPLKDKQKVQKILDDSYSELLDIMKNTKKETIAKNFNDYLWINTHFFQEVGKLSYSNNKKLILLIYNKINEDILIDLSNLNSKFYPYFEKRAKFYLNAEK